MILHGDARALPLEDRSVDVVVTSVPYFQQRTYGDDPDREIGGEATLDAYVLTLADVFDEIRRVLRPTGSAWLNIGDKANGSGGAGGDWTPEPGVRKGGGPRKFLDPAYPAQTFLDVPGAVVRELLRRGWRLRAPIVWDKGRDAPESLRHVGRPRSAHEMIYFLAPGPERPRFYPSQMVETGTVWHFPAGGDGDPHLAPFPDELPRRVIRATTLPGDVVLDPFSGSGTTARVAEAMGRVGIGVELYAAPAIVEQPCSECHGVPFRRATPDEVDEGWELGEWICRRCVRPGDS